MQNHFHRFILFCFVLMRMLEHFFSQSTFRLNCDIVWLPRCWNLPSKVLCCQNIAYWPMATTTLSATTSASISASAPSSICSRNLQANSNRRKNFKLDGWLQIHKFANAIRLCIQVTNTKCHLMHFEFLWYSLFACIT